MKIHIRFALFYAFVGHIIFRELNTIIIVPAFPRTQEHWSVYTHALDRDTLLTEVRDLGRTDLQLNYMIEETIQRLNQKGWKVNSRFLMFGHSASGMFVNRYTILHPEKVRASVVFAPGGWAIAPVMSYSGYDLRYPVGINDYYEIIGRKFDLNTYKAVPHFFVIGSKDTNDSVLYADGYEDEDRNLINNLFGKTPLERWEKSKLIYEDILENVEFKTYEDMGHIPCIDALRDTIKFYKSILEND